MATIAPILVSLSEYLGTGDYEPDAEYVDGVLEQRPMGELDHSSLQGTLFAFLSVKANRTFFRCYLELRVQVSATRFRVPDLCLLSARAPKEQIVQTPPLLCIEVLSPQDTMRRTMVRVRDFLEMGVCQVWVVDSETRTIQVCIGSSIITYTTGELTVPETPITVSLAEVFSTLDQ